MSPESTNLQETSTETNDNSPQTTANKRSREEDVLTLRNNERGTSVDMPIMEKKAYFWRDFQVNSSDTATVFESWEVILVRPTTELTTFKRILGMNIVSTYKVLKDGYTGVRAIPSYSQVELAHAVAAAENEWASRRFGLVRLMKQDTYGQDLARRIFQLPACLPSKLGALLDCRFVATNKNPHIRREWKIVMLKPIVGVMADEGRQSSTPGLWNRGIRRQSDPVQKWLVILRGQDTRISEKGFRTFNTMSNPWLEVDGRPQNEVGNTSK
ncbi:hypothetical protein F5Y09DRAFT_336389 [Xylaria sp. FL1042]|nr:hypothetical protein F5Y09DRAFT_336389 [Xylaria sp. FL1042]